MATFKRRKQRSLSPPLDVDDPPAEVADLTLWFNEVAIGLRGLAAEYPACARVKTLQALLSAWGRLKSAAAKVETVLKARQIREGEGYALGDEPPDDPMVVPLWHARQIAVLCAGAARAEELGEDDGRSIAALLKVHASAVSARETAETEHFMRQNGIRDPGKVVTEAEDATAILGEAEIEAQEDLLKFCRYVSPGFQVAPHIRLIADHLERVASGELRRLIISMPPRRGKSFLISQHFPAWFLGKRPDSKIIAISATQELSEDFGKAVRDLMRQSEMGRVFPLCRLSEDSASRKRFHTTEKGVYYAVGMGGQVTGRGAHVLVIDDPYRNREDAESEPYRRMVRDFFSSVAKTRLQSGGAIVVVQTRWSQSDLAGWLTETEGHGWTVLSLPEVAENDEEHHTSEGTWRRTTGDVLWPGFYSEGMAKDIEHGKWAPNPSDARPHVEQYASAAAAAIRDDPSTNPRDWSALFQQRPVPKEGNLCKIAWFQRYPRTSPPACTRRFISIDTAQKDGAANDYTVATVWGEFREGWAILDLWRDRLIYPSLEPEIVALVRKWKPEAVLIEDANAGTTLLQNLGTSMLGRESAFIGISATGRGSKVVRFERVTPLMESKKVWVPDSAPWIADFESEMGSFPVAKHDDICDSVSIFLNWARENTRAVDGAGNVDLSDPMTAQAIGSLSGAWGRRTGGYGGGRTFRLGG